MLKNTALILALTIGMFLVLQGIDTGIQAKAKLVDQISTQIERTQ